MSVEWTRSYGVPSRYTLNVKLAFVHGFELLRNVTVDFDLLRNFGMDDFEGDDLESGYFGNVDFETILVMLICWTMIDHHLGQ